MLGARINPLGAIKLALMLVIAAFAAATIYTSIVIGERQEALRNTNRYNVAWLASQGATELARFMERLSASAVAGSGVDADEVRLRYEILANRVRLFKDGEFRAFAETAPERREIVTAFRDAVRAGEKLIDRSDQPDARERLRELLGPLEAKLSRLAAEAHRASSEQATEDQLELLALHRTFSALAVGLICCGLALLVLVICHNRLLARMQRQLRARTDDLRHTSAQLNVALDNMSQGLCMVDAEARLTLFNGRFLGLFGLRVGAIAAGEGLGGAFRRSPYFAEGRQILDALPRAGRTNASVLALSDGRCISATYQPLPEGGWVGTYEDITERREAEAKIAHMAHFDALTDLPNRVVLMDRLESTLARLRRGDRGGADRTLGTFNALFPRGKYFGEIGLLGPSNLINLHPVVGIDLGAGWSLSTAAVFHWRESLEDGIYGNPGNLLRSAGANRARYIGTQAEIILGWEANRNLSFELSYAFFEPGRFIAETGPARNVHFLGAELQYRF